MDGIPQGDILGFVLWMGSAPAIHLIITRLLPRIAWFEKLERMKKLMVVGIISIFIPQLSLLLTNMVPPETWTMLDPNFRLLMTSANILLTWLAGELGWQINEKLKEKKMQEELNKVMPPNPKL